MQFRAVVRYGTVLIWRTDIKRLLTKMWHNTSENCLTVILILKNTSHITHQSLFQLFTNEIRKSLHKRLYTDVCRSLVTIAKLDTTRVLNNRWISKNGICVRWNTTQHRKGTGLRICAAAWMNLRNVPSKRSQTQPRVYMLWFCCWEVLAPTEQVFTVSRPAVPRDGGDCEETQELWGWWRLF